MSENTELTTFSGAMNPDHIHDDLVRLAWDAFLSSPHDVGPETLREVLAVVLPVYGAAMVANAGVKHYDRQVRLAESLTTRVARVGMLLALADEAQGAANRGVEPTLNTKLADMLRARAHREGKRPEIEP